MKDAELLAIFRCAVVLLLLAWPPAAASAAQPQMHDPRECHQSAPCVHAWFVEWRDAMISEFRFWRGLEIAVLGDPSTARTALNLAIARQMYRHNEWEIYREQPPENALSGTEFDAAFDCRMAIIDMKYMLADKSNEHAPSPRSIADYLAAATSCESAFHIPVTSSPLR